MRQFDVEDATLWTTQPRARPVDRQKRPNDVAALSPERQRCGSVLAPAATMWQRYRPNDNDAAASSPRPQRCGSVAARTTTVWQHYEPSRNAVTSLR